MQILCFICCKVQFWETIKSNFWLDLQIECRSRYRTIIRQNLGFRVNRTNPSFGRYTIKTYNVNTPPLLKQFKYPHFIAVGIFPFFRLIESYTLLQDYFDMFVSITAIIFYTKKVIHNKITSYPHYKTLVNTLQYILIHIIHNRTNKSYQHFYRLIHKIVKFIHDLQIVINKLSTTQITHKIKHNINHCSIFIHITITYYRYNLTTFYSDLCRYTVQPLAVVHIFT